MDSFQLDTLTIRLNKEGQRKYTKASYPVRYGRFAEIKMPHYLYQFNLNGEIKYIQGLRENWPHPSEWLKRTAANDWVYYTTGGYTGICDFFGEYYLPCLSYPSNSLIGGNPFENCAVLSAIDSFNILLTKIKSQKLHSMPQIFKDFLIRVSENDAEALRSRSDRLHEVIGGWIPVLPPDTRHVDYDVIPLIVADGCLYNCEFCNVKSSRDFVARTKSNILDQIIRLKEFYAQDIRNYNALFLGQQDALYVGQDLIEYAVKKAYDIFEFDRSHMHGAYLFLFGSVDSLLTSENILFEMLNTLPFSTCINIGLESFDSKTLSVLHKPVTSGRIHKAFMKMLDINRRYENLEVTANFLFGDCLPQSHFASFFEFMRDRLDRFYSKGVIYFSPFINGSNNYGSTQKKREMLKKFYRIKTISRFPTFLYLIQRS